MQAEPDSGAAKGKRSPRPLRSRRGLAAAARAVLVGLLIIGVATASMPAAASMAPRARSSASTAENSRLGIFAENSGISALESLCNPANCLQKEPPSSTKIASESREWTSPDPMLASYFRGQPAGGVFRPGNLGLYSYTWNNPLRFRDPDGRALRPVAEPQSKGDERYSKAEHDRMAVERVSEVSGSRAFLDKTGHIQLGEQVKSGKNWDEARMRMQALIDDKREVGLSANNHQACGGFGFVPRDSEKNADSRAWARGNGLDAWINFGKESGVDHYTYANPAYRGFFRELGAWLSGGTSNPAELTAPHTVGDAFAHEAIGHGYGWVSGGDFGSEARAQDAENIFRAAQGRPTGYH